MGFILKLLFLVILFYIVFNQFDKRVLRQKIISGVLKSKFLEKDSVPKTHFGSSLIYFKEKEKYFATLLIGEYLVTEEVNKDIYLKLVVDEPIILIKHYTKLTNNLIKIEIKA